MMKIALMRIALVKLTGLYFVPKRRLIRFCDWRYSRRLAKARTPETKLDIVRNWRKERRHLGYASEALDNLEHELFRG